MAVLFGLDLFIWSTPVAVTSVGLATPSWLAVTGSPVTTTGTLTIAAATGQTSHQVIGTCGSAATFGPCALVAGDLPMISLSTGVSGTLQAAQEPAHTGDVTNSAGSLAMTVGAIKGVTVPTLAAGYLYYNGSTFAFQTPSGGGNVTNSGTPTSGQLATWVSSTGIQGVTTLPTAAMPPLSGDLNGTSGSLSVTVSGLKGIAVPAPTAGWLYYSGSTYSWSTPVAVTSVGLATPSWLAVTGSPVTTTGTLTIAAATGQTSHQVIGTCGSAATFGPCALVAGDLPMISLSTGVSGTLQAAQEPAHTGDVTNSAGSLAMTVGAIKGVTVPTLAAGYLYYNGSTFAFQTPSGGGNVTNSGTPTSGQLATWVSSTGIQGVTTLPTAAMPPLSGDLNGTSGSLSVTVSGLKGIAVPAPTAGWLYYSGSTYSWSTPVAVTSVGLATPSWLAVTGSPVTTTGTLTIAAATGQTSHQVIGTCGSAATFGPCALVAGDLPMISLSTGVSGLLPNTNLANSAVTLNGQTCTLGATCSLPFQSNGTNLSSQAGVNFTTSTTNAVGLAVTPVNTSGDQLRFEVSGGAYSGIAATATALASTPSQCAAGLLPTGIAANGNANCASVGVLIATWSSGALPTSDNASLVVTSNTGAASLTGPALGNNLVFSIYNPTAYEVTYSQASGSLLGSTFLPPNSFAFQYSTGSGSGATTYLLAMPTLQSFPDTSAGGLALTFTQSTGKFGTIPVGTSNGWYQAASPTFSPAPGTYSSAQTVAITCSSANTVPWYSLNGGSTLVQASPTSSISTPSTLVAQCRNNSSGGWTDSVATSGLYTINSATISLAQQVRTSSCTASSTCVLTISSTGAGNAAVIMGSGTYAIASVSGGSGTWVVPAGCQVSGGATLSCAYNLGLSSGSTSITVTWASTPAAGARLDYREFSTTGTSFTLDSGGSGGLGTITNGTASTTQPGVALTIGGTVDVIVQQMNFSGGTPSGVTVYSNFSGSSFTAAANLLNTTSGTAPTWTNSSSNTSIGNAVALSVH